MAFGADRGGGCGVQHLDWRRFGCAARWIVTALERSLCEL